MLQRQQGPVWFRNIRIRKLDNRPPLVVAPFDSEQASKYQEEWAEYLGVPVEKEVALPGGESLLMVLIPPGEFDMGSSDEEQARFLEVANAKRDHWTIDRISNEGPQHRIRITRPFYLGKFEVTQAQWQAAMRSNPSRFKNKLANPVEQVSWDDVQLFLIELNESDTAEDLTFQLPTEAQWEYACRAGTITPWHCGDSDVALKEYCWFNENSGGRLQPVGELRPNHFGLYDMQGNVWEWCADWFVANYYETSPVNDPTAQAESSQRVKRGGGWHGTDDARDCRSALRAYLPSGQRAAMVGLRLLAQVDSERLPIAAHRAE